jgi:DNA repair exonuclease SbcCD ATPase subunit
MLLMMMCSVTLSHEEVIDIHQEQQVIDISSSITSLITRKQIVDSLNALKRSQSQQVDLDKNPSITTEDIPATIDALTTTDNKIITILIQLSDEIDTLLTTQQTQSLPFQSDETISHTVSRLEKELQEFSNRLTELNNEKGLLLNNLEVRLEQLIRQKEDESKFIQETNRVMQTTLDDLLKSFHADTSRIESDHSLRFSSINDKHEIISNAIQKLQELTAEKDKAINNIHQQLVLMDQNSKLVEGTLSAINSRIATIEDESNTKFDNIIQQVDDIPLAIESMQVKIQDSMRTQVISFDNALDQLRKSFEETKELISLDFETLKDDFEKREEMNHLSIQQISENFSGLQSSLTEVNNKFEKIGHGFHQIQGRSQSTDITLGRFESNLKSLDVLVKQNFHYLQEIFQGHESQINEKVKTLTETFENHNHEDIWSSHEEWSKRVVLIEDEVKRSGESWKEEFVTLKDRMEHLGITGNSLNHDLIQVKLTIEGQGNSLAHVSSQLNSDLEHLKLSSTAIQSELVRLDEKHHSNLDELRGQFVRFQEESISSTTSHINEEVGKVTLHIAVVENKCEMRFNELKQHVSDHQKVLLKASEEHSQAIAVKDEQINQLQKQLMEARGETDELKTQLRNVIVKIDQMSQQIHEITIEQNNHPIKVMKRKLQPFYQVKVKPFLQKMVTKLGKLGNKMIQTELPALPSSREVKVDIGGVIADKQIDFHGQQGLDSSVRIHHAANVQPPVSESN